MMRIAITHDTLSEFGGMERVLLALLKIFPQADIYTSYFNKEFLKQYLPNTDLSQIHSSFIQNTPITSRHSIIRAISPIIWRSFDFSNYDLIISNSGYLASNLINCRKRPHIQYISSPPKQLFGMLPRSLSQRIIPYTNIIAGYYKQSVLSTPHMIVNSNHIKNIMTRLFGIHPKVIYPPVRIPSFNPGKYKKKYFMVVSRLDTSKNIELAIHVFNSLKLPLKIVGESSTSEYGRKLKNLTGPTVEILGWRSDKEIDKLYQSATAFIFTADNEDFGIAPVEAMAHGVPVIAHYSGGVRESVIDNKTGIFFDRQDNRSLISAIKIFKKQSFDPEFIHHHALKFGENIFIDKIRKYIRNIF